MVNLEIDSVCTIILCRKIFLVQINKILSCSDQNVLIYLRRPCHHNIPVYGYSRRLCRCNIYILEGLAIVTNLLGGRVIVTYHKLPEEAYAFVIYCFIKEGPFIVLWIFILNFVIAILRGPAFVLYIYLRGPCYCTTCTVYIVLYTNLEVPCDCTTVLYWTIHLPEGALLLYYTVLYCTRHLPEGALLLSWWLEEEAGSPIFTSCPNCFTPSSVQIWN